MHLKIIALEIVTNSKSGNMWNLFIPFFTHIKKTPLWFCGNFQL